MTTPLDEFDAARLAVAAKLATDVRGEQSCEEVLGQLCQLVSAQLGVVLERRDDRVTTHCQWGSAACDVTIPLRVTLVARGHEVGAVELHRAGSPFDAHDRRLVDLVAPRLASLVEHHHLVQAETAAREAARIAFDLLRAKDERFEAMVEGAEGFVGLLSPEGLLLEVNRSALALVGAARTDVVDRPFWLTPWWAHDEAQRARLQSAIEGAAQGRATAFEVTHLSTEGRTVVVDFSVRPVYRDGAVRFLVVEGRDVTARSQEQVTLAKSRDEIDALHRAVVETIVDGIVVIDGRGVIAWTNQAAERMFGYTDTELRGQNVSVLMSPADASQHDGYLRRYLATGERHIIGIGREVRGRRKDGSEFPLDLAVGETVVNGARTFTGVLRDRSETKRLEQLLQERQTLARIGELAAVVAHEVRNPLAAIRGVVEVIRTRFADGSSDHRVLGDLLTRVDSLDQLVGDLLVYARPAPPAFRLVAILGLVRETATLVTGHQTSCVRVSVSGDDAELWLDPAQMSRAVLNLLTNAAQVTPRDGIVEVTGRIAGECYQLVVRDQGRGMSDEAKARCFEPFFTTKTRGTGLGLPIAKRVVDEHRGKLSIVSAPGHGTEVTIELPLARPEEFVTP